MQRSHQGLGYLMPQIAIGLLAAAGVPGLVTAAGALTTAGAFLSGALGLGLNFAIQQLFATPQPKPEDVKNTIRNTISARWGHYGRVQVGGVVAQVATRQRELHRIIMIGEGPIEEFEAFRVDKKTVTVPALGPPNDAGLYPGDNWVPGPPHARRTVRVEWRNGEDSQTAFAMMVSRFAASWGANHRLRGIACVHIAQMPVDEDEFRDVYPNNFVEVQSRIKGRRVYDPRTATTIWSRNLALILASYMTHPAGGRIPFASIDWAGSVTTAANVCDELVTKKSGSQIARYHGALSYRYDEEPASVIARLLQAFDGWMTLNEDGKIRIEAGAWIAPTVTISEEHIVAIEIRDGAGPESEASVVITQYTDTENNYTETTSTWRNEPAIALIGEVSTSLPAYEIQDHNHADRIGKINAARRSPRYRISLTTNLHGLNAWSERRIRLVYPIHEIDAPFDVISIEDDMEANVIRIELISADASAYTFNAATEETVPPPPPDDDGETTEDVPIPDSITATIVTRRISDYTDNDTQPDFGNQTGVPTSTTGEITVYSLRVAFPLPPAGFRIEVEFKASDEDDWTEIPVAPGQASVRSSSLDRDKDFIARVRHRSVSGRRSAWRESTSVSTPP
jgi:hypothetical protein